MPNSEPILALVGPPTQTASLRGPLQRAGLTVRQGPGGPGEPVDVVVLWAPGAVAELQMLLREQHDLRPGASVVVVLGSVDTTSVRRAMEQGADAVVGPSDLDRELPSVVRCVVAGLTVVPREGRHSISPPALSHRERQVLTLLLEGCANAQIACRLYLAESTVKSHLSSAFAKLGVRSRRDAVTYILNADPATAEAILDPQRPVAAASSTPVIGHRVGMAA